MTLLKIEILIHYFYKVPDYNNADFSTTAVRNAIDWMIGTGKLLEASPESGVNYQITERGRVYVEALLMVPLPILSKPKWEMPKIK